MPTASALTWMGTIFYVDDAVLIARSLEELQRMLNVCQQWAEKNRMSIKLTLHLRQEFWLHKHTTSAIKERVRIPAHSLGPLGLVVKVKENDTAIVEVAGLGQVELRVQDLTHVSLVITDVDCFKYLGLNLDYVLRMEEATKAVLASIRFTHSKVAATLHSLHQLPRRGNNVFSRKHYRTSCTDAQKVKSNSGKQLFFYP